MVQGRHDIIARTCAQRLNEQSGLERPGDNRDGRSRGGS